MVVANHVKALAAFDGKSNLASTRDYSRAVEKVPSGIVAFGGYNLEAAIAAAESHPVTQVEALIANIIFSVASAFHSQNFYATVTAGTVEGRSSVAMDREGRYPVADLSLPAERRKHHFVTVEPSWYSDHRSKTFEQSGGESSGQSSLVQSTISRTISKTADQTVEQKSAKELLLTIAARRGGSEKAVELPVKDPEFADVSQGHAGICGR